MKVGSTSPRRTALALVLATIVAITTAAPGRAAVYPPPGNKTFHGVSDTGKLDALRAFEDATAAHPAVIQNFVTWGKGAGLEEAYRHWHKMRSRGMLSISTAAGYAEPGVISPMQIARGKGDGYILRLNRELYQLKDPVYIRLLPEMNGHWNAYSAFNADGSSRGRSHATNWFRQAWRRFTIIVRGGKLTRVNHRLRKLNLPRVKPRWRYENRGLPARLPRPKVSLIWVPQTSGSPKLRRNRPRPYWPGSGYVDWVGLDTYSKFPNFDAMTRFYKRKQWKRKPFMVGEYAPWDADASIWLRRLFRWESKHKRAKMLVYYQGFGVEGNPFLIQNYPSSREWLTRILRRKHYLRYAPASRDGLGKVKRAP